MVSQKVLCVFPFLFGGTFIEGDNCPSDDAVKWKFPFLFGGTFIEGNIERGF